MVNEASNSVYKQDKMTPEQLETISQFMKTLFNKDTEMYWNLICKIDQSRIYGMYKASTTLGFNCTFFDYVENEIKTNQKKIYEKVEKDYGISNIVHYKNNGDVKVHLMEDVKTPIYYIAKTQVKAYPVVLTLDTYLNEGEFTASWKIRLYEDHNYSNLHSD